MVGGHTSRPLVRDHRAPLRPHAGRPYHQRHVYWPSYHALASVGVLDSDRVFGALGAGLALPFAPRLTLAGYVRAASIGDTEHHDEGETVMDTRDRTLEGRLTLVVDF